MLANNVAPEQARIVLPLNTMTNWVWSGSLFAFARVCNLRLDPHAQVEVQEVAKLISEEVSSKFPISWKYLVEDK
jgi:thymidylate synthase (FAD)